MAWYIYSSLSAPVQYCTYVKNDSRAMAIVEKRITIKGGANIATKHLVTPRGVRTEVSDEDYEQLMQNSHFQDHMKNKFIFVDPVKANPDKVAVNNLEKKDQSAPKTPDDPEYQNKKREGIRVREDSKGTKGSKK